MRLVGKSPGNANGAAAQRRRRAISPPRIVVLSFAAAIALGTSLLLIPAATAPGRQTGFLDALFTATSATCVTGLVVLDTGRHFSRFGHVVILALIQAGGLGIMTFSTAFLLLFGRRLSFKEKLLVRDSLSRSPVVQLRSLIGSIMLITLTFEFAGALVLCLHFHSRYGYDPFQAFHHGLFHSVSAFCNAGFSLYSDSLVRFNRDWVTIATMAALIVAGGLGFIVLYNILGYRFWMRDRTERGRLSLQTRIVLVTSAILLAAMFACFLSLEWNASLAGLAWPEKALNALFHAVTPRTAGFNTVHLDRMGAPILFITLCMMFIGASPGSTGGGIKTCTLAVLFATSRAFLKGSGNVHLMRRYLGHRTVAEAVCVAVFAICVIIGACSLLLVTEAPADASAGGVRLMPVLFETISAFGTVGLSTGLTPSLSPWGRVLVIATMFIGRVGPLTIALIIARGEALPPVRYAEEDVMIG
ncbi:MAG: potassium transporter TrkG [bacterium]|nr:potassium transporter TrkG [bacterium]